MYSIVKKISGLLLCLGLMTAAIPTQAMSLNGIKRFWQKTKLVFDPNWQNINDRMEIILLGAPIVLIGSGAASSAATAALERVHAHPHVVLGGGLISVISVFTGLYRHCMHNELKRIYNNAETELQNRAFQTYSNN